jgi:hypothetical protein
MIDSSPKRAILAVLRYEPDFSGLVGLPALETQAGQALVQWLDRSGLALIFCKRLQECNATKQISEAWHQSLELRYAKNVARARDMLMEAQRLNSTFRSFGVTAASLKGFTLTPDFCDDLTLRHQVDFDFLVAPGSVSSAAEALRSCGYSTPRVNESGETCFRTPLQDIPSPNDDLYALQRHRQVDLHTSIWEPCPWLPVETPQDCLENARPQNISGAEFFSLTLEDKFILQVLHVFRHSFRSWIRISWLLEIVKCLEKRQNDLGLWKRVIRRAGFSRLTKSIFAFVLGLCERMFHGPIPPALYTWTSEAMTLSLRAWLGHFAFDWVISDWPGSLNNLFLTAEFVPDPRLQMQYWRSRLLPGRKQTSLGSVAATSPKRFFQLQAARLSYVAHRVAVHLKDIVALPHQQFRWRRALASARRPGFDLNC